ncbi:ExbD/TolR family protein [Vreelandella venusta]|uniref:Biopolymer transporter ExbD n=1 Tax=Vreelandella venusta TaxID=44935 RepID=A0AAP9ZAP1_9GAMM|nr:biopolymer transporter ExbD [Halomonas venusta]MBR9924337.1 biopolymer transporter ExbD [Gammaproteobacteria bacterium]AZM96298.1 biopolymer transporter ExbD [Halomonas venusta]MDW0358192.1 biopolymer transporter ExbD [Halomonas venusta]MDX1712244.1 biopolymer transporter ExbD [Halomonas venusta]NPT30408.1 biopolymer transporter ExbD [Halomonas venusta]
MRRRRSIDATADSNEVNLTPMLDVVFIMLIFFIVTTSFIKESGVEIERPEAAAASPRPDAQVLIAVTPEGAVWVDGKPVDVHRIGQQVADMLSDDGSVVIQADRESTTGLLIEVMDRLKQAGVDQIAVAASRSAS